MDMPLLAELWEGMLVVVFGYVAPDGAGFSVVGCYSDVAPSRAG